MQRGETGSLRSPLVVAHLGDDLILKAPSRDSACGGVPLVVFAATGKTWILGENCRGDRLSAHLAEPVVPRVEAGERPLDPRKLRLRLCEHLATPLEHGPLISEIIGQVALEYVRLFQMASGERRTPVERTRRVDLLLG